MTEAEDTKPDPAPAPAAVQPDLEGLQRLIDAEKAKGSSEATSALLSTLGFDSIDTLQTFVTSQREAAEAAKTEEQKRADAIAAREAAAVAREQAAAELIRTGVVNLALVRAGVDPANVADAAPLVTLGDDLTDAAADAAVAALKAKPAFASLFGASAKPAPSGVTAPAPAGAGGGTVTALERGAALYAKRHPAKSA